MNELEQPKGKAAPAIERLGDMVPTDFASLWGETISLAPTERNKLASERYSIGDDGLIVEHVGDWASTKHRLLTRYVHASGGARQRFRGTGAAYIDVFCGPGRSMIPSGKFIDGSAIAAFKQGLLSPAGFTSIEISDVRPNLLNAAETRLTALGAPVRTEPGPAVNAMKEIVRRIPRDGLHLAFLDPHNLGALSFDLFRELAKLRHVDVIVHVSAADLQRNTGLYTSTDRDEFDEFAPDWRKHVGEDMNNQALRGEIIKYWSGKVQALGLPRAPHCELIRGSKDQRLYWLIFLASNDLAHRLWTAISSEARQPTLGL